MILSDPLFKDGNVRLTTVSLKPLCVCCIICVCKLPKSWQSAETAGVCAVYTVQCTVYSLNTAQRQPAFSAGYKCLGTPIYLLDEHTKVSRVPL